MLIVVVGWVFFRAAGLKEALRYIGVMFGIIRPENVGYTVWAYLDAKIIIALILAVIASLPVFGVMPVKRLTQSAALKVVSAVLSLLMLFVCAVFVMASTYNPFIYFRF